MFDITTEWMRPAPNKYSRDLLGHKVLITRRLENGKPKYDVVIDDIALPELTANYLKTAKTRSEKHIINTHRSRHDTRTTG